MYLKPYRLISRTRLRDYMRNPRTGPRQTVRSLAEATGMSRSKISGLLTNRRPGVYEHEAAAVAKALGFPMDHLFTTTASAYANTNEHQAPTQEETP